MDENNSKEINLLQLLNLFFKWLTKVFKASLDFAGKILQLLFKYKWMTLAVIVLSLSFALYLSRPSQRIYKAEALAVTHGSDVQTLKEICKQLENALSTNKNLSLATKIGIPDSISTSIVGIKTFDVIDYLKDGTADKVDFNNSHALDDTLNLKMNDRLYVQIKTTKIAHVPFIQQALLKYFSSNPLLISKFEFQRKNYIDKINICDLELRRIDSLAKVMYFKDNLDQLKLENNKLLIGENRKQLFYGELLEINTLKGNAQSGLAECISPVTFPSDFVVIPQPVNGRLKYSVYGLIAAFGISVLLAFALENLKKIIQFLENK